MSTVPASRYPDAPVDRDRWIAERRGAREAVDPQRPYAFLVEDERFADGTVGPVATVFLTNRECPWRCAMCDLWQHTLTSSVPPGAIPEQIAYALSRQPTARQIKLYNSGSFFDRQAIPEVDYAAIAALVGSYERVIVESHPALIGGSCWRLQELLKQQRPEMRMEVAMGLETAHPEVLAKLNKLMTLEQYAAAAKRLAENGIDLRSFVLVQPPFMRGDESLHWACRSIDFAASCGATAISLIPTRAGNGAVDDLAASGDFVPPQLRTIEDAQDYGIRLGKGRVFVDLWEIARVVGCSMCRAARVARLQRMNFVQTVLPRVGCEACRGEG